jgi:Spy/CpxP family protein refolding chaperone
MKINSIKTGALGVVSLLLLALSIAVSGQGPQGRGGPPPGGGFPGGPGRGDGLGPIARDLNLSDEQRTQIQKITDSSRENMKALQDQLRVLSENEPDSLTSAYDEAAVRADAEARAKVEVELSVARAKMLSQIGAVLTTEQKAKIVAKRQEFSQRQRPPQE